jgi:hypothetical protein
MRSAYASRLLALAAVVGGRAEETPMSDDPTLVGPPTFTLASPGVGITNDPEALESSMGTYWVHLGKHRQLRTVEWFPGHDSESPRIQPGQPVEWDTSVPWGAELFSVTAGVSAARVRQFWTGWLSGRHNHMEPHDGIRTLSSALEADESVIFPAVMDGSGAASVYTWRPTANGATLWQRVFTKWSADDPRSLLEIPGRPLLSHVASAGGLRVRHAVIGWVEQPSPAASVLGIAVIEEGRPIKVMRSAPLSAVPLPSQRIGAWTSDALDAFQVAAVVVGATDSRYRLVGFGTRPGEREGRLSEEALDVKPGDLVRSALDYGRRDQPYLHRALLLHDGRVLGEGRVLRTGVPLDSELPIVMVGASAYWHVRRTDGTFQLDSL